MIGGENDVVTRFLHLLHPHQIVLLVAVEMAVEQLEGLGYSHYR